MANAKFEVIGNIPSMPGQRAISAEYEGLSFPCGSVENPEEGVSSIRWNVEAQVFKRNPGLSFDEKYNKAKEESEKIVTKFMHFIESANTPG